MTALDIYLISLADSIKFSGGPMMFCSGLSIFIFASSLLIEPEIITCASKKFMKFIVIPVLLLGMSIKVFVPSSKTIAAMYLIPAISQNEDLQEMFGDSLSIMKGQLKVWAKELDK